MKWFEEVDNDNGVGLKIQISEQLFSKKSPFQQVDVYQTTHHGKLLTHDGLIMVTEKDEHVYHDMIVHVPMFTHPDPKNVLIIGGGDGGSAREVLRHKNVEKCVMVEIDPVVIEAAREHLPTTSCEFDNPKLELLVDDGVNYVAETNTKFDVIIIDSSDPIGPATPLFNKDFYKNVYNCLSANGVVVSQCESPYYHQKMQQVLVEILAEQFPKVHLYNYTNLTYPGGFWTFSFASKGLCPVSDFQTEKYAKTDLKFKYYNQGMHKGSFALPQFMIDTYQELLSPL